MTRNDVLHIFGFHFRIQNGFPLVGNHLHQGHLVTHSHAANMFQLDFHSGIVYRFLYGLPDIVTSAGYTA